MYKNPTDYLKHILDECLYINKALGAGLTKNEFLDNETLKRATVRSLEIIGEATKNNPSDVKLKWAHVNWKNMAGMRDRLIHDYMGVNYSIVWDVVRNKIPELTEQITKVLENERNKPI